MYDFHVIIIIVQYEIKKLYILMCISNQYFKIISISIKLGLLFTEVNIVNTIINIQRQHS